jgi:hypothetical protein
VGEVDAGQASQNKQYGYHSSSIEEETGIDF